MRSDAEAEGDSKAILLRRFHQVVAVLADGALMYPPPFDLATSLALAANIDTGDLAEKLHAVTAARDTKYQVTIYQCDDEHGMRREVVDTTVSSSSLLQVLLEAVLDELETATTHHL